MTISLRPPRNPSSWNAWHHPRTTRGISLNSGFAVGSAPFPSKYLPAKAFWAFTPSSHCNFPAPWAFSGDPFTNALLAGGGSGTLIGISGGLAIVDLQLRDPTSVSYGIGMRDGYGIPTVGFCFGDRYKEHAYFAFKVLRVGTGVGNAIVNAATTLDVFQRCRLKRIYVIEGVVVRFVDGPIVENGTDQTYILTLDLTGTVPDGVNSVEGNQIKIYKKNGETCVVTIKKLLANFDMVVSNSGTSIPESGDFYKIDTPWCIEDPYMMSGFWYGKEGEIERTEILPNSGNNLFITSHNIPYNKVKFSGAYVCKNKVDDGPVLLPPGTIFAETSSYRWVWSPYSGVETSYPDTDRFFEAEEYVDENGDVVTTIDNDSTLTYVTKKFETSSSASLSDWINENGSTYVRLEIDIGGNPTLQNWHSSALTKCFLTQGEKRFAIFGQPNADVIDVSIRDTTNSVNLDPNSGGTIINQYAWMINEHYSGSSLFFNGDFTSNTYDSSSGISTVTIKSDSFSNGTISQNTDESFSYLPVNSFYNRFISTYSGGSGLKKLFIKFAHWRLGGDKPYEIVDGTLTFSSESPNPPSGVSASMKVYGKVESSSGGLFFDEPYKRYTKSQSVSVPIFACEMYESTQNGLPILCGDMSYLSVPIEQFLPSGTIVGITGGKYWHLGSSPSDVFNEKDLFLMVTTPITQKAVSAFYHHVREQDWVVYKDKFTENLCFRTANLDFREYPTKYAISIGFSESGSGIGAFPITFDQTKDIVKLVEIKVPEAVGGGGTNSGGGSDDFGTALTFQINNPNDYFGFPSTSSGTFDFQALRLAGHEEGTVDFSKYKYKGDFVSPVYLYSKTENVNYQDNLILGLGISTKDKLLVKNGSANVTKIDYVKNKQVLNNISYFDCHLMNDGEVILFYCRDTHEFMLNGKRIKPSGSPRWTTVKSIHTIGSANGGFQWGTPAFQNLNFNQNQKYQYSTMIVNSCEYISSFYSALSGCFGIFMRCYHSSNQPYYGFMMVNKMSLTEDLIHCTPTVEYENIDLPFWLRVPKLSSSVAGNQNIMYVNQDSKIISPITDGVNKDMFIRVLGPVGTNCDIESDEVIEIATICTLSVGIPVILYGSKSGIRILSSSHTIKWTKSEIIISKTGTSPVLIDENLFYISPEGIVAITGIRQFIYDATLMPENTGINVSFIEQLQETIDSLPHVLIGSGVIDSQRLSGYTSSDGNCKIFYYNKNDILCCLNSKNLVKWQMSYNF